MSIAPRERMAVHVTGAVQGVGFRPFVYRLATDTGLDGWVNNSPQGVSIEVEGSRAALDEFLLRLHMEKPSIAVIESADTAFLEPSGYHGFEIRASRECGEKKALILPDLATCPDCLRELLDPSDRRYLYPFTNCTNCGPRFSIIEALPYDRPNTTMKVFPMCKHCRAEYEDPLNRRFHAQPNACPRCGPHLELWSPGGEVKYSHQQALLAATDAIRHGAIVAVKGLGGFHLVVDARNKEAVWRLRQRKHREEKPFALMYPSLAMAEEHCVISDAEGALLLSHQSPIVLLKRLGGSVELAPNVAPGNPNLGVMLPYTPLHHILMSELGFPVVATSGNLADEPICTDEHEALQRLGGIADLFLVHNRPIKRHVDDSVVRRVMDRPMILRRARGYAPMPVRLSSPVPTTTLAVGAHLKNSVALAVGRDVFISQHIGDLETVQATEEFEQVIADFEQLYDAHPARVACDAHPDYLSSQFARRTGLPLHAVQHHAAHVFACMAENGLDRVERNETEQAVLGVSWDGTGYAPDGTVWGGEFLRVKGGTVTRVAHLRTFSLPGGEKAIREPRRVAIGLLYEMYGDALPTKRHLAPVQACTSQELGVWQAMMRRGVNAPFTSSAGRLFDAVASLLGLRQHAAFEGQAAMDLEFALAGADTDESYPFRVTNSGSAGPGPIIVDWALPVRGVLLDTYFCLPVGQIAAKFHNTLAEMIVKIAQLSGETNIALTGGCFQNVYLLERTIDRLRAEGLKPYWHTQVPPNDGGIALGQVVAALAFAEG